MIINNIARNGIVNVSFHPFTSCLCNNLPKVELQSQTACGFQRDGQIVLDTQKRPMRISHMATTLCSRSGLGCSGRRTLVWQYSVNFFITSEIECLFTCLRVICISFSVKLYFWSIFFLLGFLSYEFLPLSPSVIFRIFWLLYLEFALGSSLCLLFICWDFSF